MQCNCGGSTVERQVVRNKEVAGVFLECTSCGRIKWEWKSDSLTDEIEFDRLVTPANGDSHG